jgi:hypothetical protein
MMFTTILVTLSFFQTLSSLQTQVNAQNWGYEKETAFCETSLGSNVTIVFTADPGLQYGGIGEGYYIARAMKSPKTIKIPGCYQATVGTISGFTVAQIVTGEGPQAAQTCTLNVLQCSSVISSMYYFGTAGFSPRLGGVLNPNSGDCSTPSSAGKMVRPGDLCVSFHATNWDCQGGEWSDTSKAYPNVCSIPGDPNQPYADAFSNPSTAQYRGWDCFVYPIAPAGSGKMANDLISMGSTTVSKVTPPADIQQYSSWYWGNTSLAMGYNFSAFLNVSAPPTIFRPDECAEIDTVFWWQGLPWDAQARGMVAWGLSESVGRRVNASQVVAASAMEGVGFLGGARQAYNLTGKAIPYTIIRSASDWVHQPVKKATAGGDVWIPADNVSPPPGLSSNTASASVFAIQTGSTLILGAFRQQCLNLGNVASVCDFIPPNVPSHGNWIVPSYLIILASVLMSL